MTIGTMLLFTSSIGMVRFQDIYSKIHSVGVADTAGTIFLLTGVSLCSMASLMYFLKITLLISLVLITSVMASVSLARSEGSIKK